jgi:hypothetical protein
MGEWPDGSGPFERLLFELRSWNELHERAFATKLLRTTDRPREFGWILRPSQREYEAFVHQLDKLLSENLDSKAFDKLGVPAVDGEGNRIGTLNRLDRFLEILKIGEESRRAVLKPLRDARTARQRPAHALRANITDRTFIRKQAELLGAVGASLQDLRMLWQRHPANKEWTPPEWIENGKHYWL